MKLKGQIYKDSKEISKAHNALFKYQKQLMAKEISKYQKDVQNILVNFLSRLPEIDYSTFVSNYEKQVLHELESCAPIEQLINLWWDLRNHINLSGRLHGGFIARKATPPWISVRMNISDPALYQLNIRNSVTYSMRGLIQLIMGQINIGIKNQEQLGPIIQRVTSLFKSPLKKAKEAASAPFNFDELRVPDDTEKFDDGNFIVEQGVFNQQDINKLRTAQIKAMGWMNRQYDPNMDDRIWKRNKAMMGLERDMLNDSLFALHNGLITVGSENMGIKDFVWITSFLETTCEVCGARDGMTMKEIEEKFGKGKFPRGEAWPSSLRQNDPPPLHPHCNCQIAADIKDDWSEKALEKDGYTWNPDSGIYFSPTGEQKKLGFTDMTWDQWLGNLGGT